MEAPTIVTSNQTKVDLQTGADWQSHIASNKQIQTSSIDYRLSQGTNVASSVMSGSEISSK